jgi:hypothetical protein
MMSPGGGPQYGAVVGSNDYPYGQTLSSYGHRQPPNAQQKRPYQPIPDIKAYEFGESNDTGKKIHLGVRDLCNDSLGQVVPQTVCFPSSKKNIGLTLKTNSFYNCNWRCLYFIALQQQLRKLSLSNPVEP